MPTALPASTDFTGAGVTEADFKTAMTALRAYLSGLLGTDGASATALATLGAALGGAISAKTTTYAVVAGDKGGVIDCTGTWTLSLLAAATAGANFTVSVRNSGSGVITVDPNLTETIDGGSTLTINAGESAIIVCTGTTWLTVGRSGGTPSGSLVAYAGSSAPAGWLLADGSAVSRTTYASLFSAISTTFGVGDGSSTFNLPDLRGRVPAGKDNMGGSAASRLTTAGGLSANNTLGATGGAETHTLTTAEMPAHSHPGSTVTVPNPANPAYTAAGGADAAGSATASASVTVASQGGGAAHSIVQPTLVINYIIKT